MGRTLLGPPRSRPSGRLLAGGGARTTPLAAAAIYALLALVALAIGFPFFWMVATSLKELPDVFVFSQLLPPEPQWANYPNALRKAPFARYFFNSVFTAAAILALQLATIIPAAYGFARLRFPGRDALFVLVLATMMVPVQVTFIPAFVLISRLGWKDTYPALIVPFATSAFGIFLLRQAFLQVHQSFVDAARLDGCGHLGVMRHVMVPQTAPALITFGLFSFVAHYNDLFWPLVVTESERMRTITMGLSSFIEFEGGTRWNELMVASLVSMLPLILLFLAAQRFFIKGMAGSGIKG
jgi:multiple sugar transport system permease protein/sn-glycerol 3-phosphate transport system permease protein